MKKKPGIKKLHSLFLAYLVITLLGSFAFSISGTFNPDNFGGTRQNSGSYFPILNKTLDFLAVNPNTLTNTNKNSNHSYRSCMMRIFMFAGISAAVLYFSIFPFYSTKSNNISSHRNTILLKLRI